MRGKTSIAIGRSDGTGAIDINAITFTDPTTIQAPAGTGSITVGGLITGAGNASISLISNTTIALNAGITTTSAVNIDSTGVTTIAAAGDINAGGAVTFGAAFTGPIDFSAVSNVTSVVTPPPAPGGGIAASTPADAAFCSDIAACGVVVDVFGTDYSLVEAGGGSESEYVASPFVTEGFWEQLLEDAEE